MLVAALLLAGFGLVPLASGTSAQADPVASSDFAQPLVNGYGADPEIYQQDGKYVMMYSFDIVDPSRAATKDIWAKVSDSLAGLNSAPLTYIYSLEAGHGTKFASGWMVHDGGYWYMYGIGDAETPNQIEVIRSEGDDILGPYHFLATISNHTSPTGVGYAFFPIVVNGQFYATETGDNDHSIYIAPMNGPTSMAGGWTKIAQATAPWECANGRCIDEGTNIYIRNGIIYDIFSAGGYESPDYCVGMLTASVSANLTDPASWTKSNNCVISRNDSAGVYGPGSAGWFTATDGTPWVVYHVKTTTDINFYGGDRRLEASPVTFDGSGNPNFGTPQSINSWRALPGLDPGIRKYEAESATLAGGAQVRGATSASGGQYVGGIDVPGASKVTFPDVYANWTGKHTFRVYYANHSGGPSKQAITVNGAAAGTVSYAETGAWGLSTRAIRWTSHWICRPDRTPSLSAPHRVMQSSIG
ncbi:family 43 glycosylhydrolase [Naasia aerilata]|uniref:family 43 glycosylhydrolase n=1 Tax=Naasia aerilata TaxID=1162966 RepID=UPI002573EB24|nr:family 43 glycosylhydrolase [Naasia aerilata]